MIREEVINYGYECLMNESLFPSDREFVEIAIKALEQELCEDAISRQAAIDVVEDMHDLARSDVLSEAVKQLKDLPPVTPHQKIGRWIEERNDYGKITHWHCSNCYDDSGFITTCKWDYCPNCGAMMQEVEE